MLRSTGDQHRCSNITSRSSRIKNRKKLKEVEECFPSPPPKKRGIRLRPELTHKHTEYIHINGNIVQNPKECKVSEGSFYFLIHCCILSTDSSAWHTLENQ